MGVELREDVRGGRKKERVSSAVEGHEGGNH
jgi:hypothetical protein